MCKSGDRGVEEKTGKHMHFHAIYPLYLLDMTFEGKIEDFRFSSESKIALAKRIAIKSFITILVILSPSF